MPRTSEQQQQLTSVSTLRDHNPDTEKPNIHPGPIPEILHVYIFLAYRLLLKQTCQDSMDGCAFYGSALEAAQSQLEPVSFPS